MKTDSFGTQRRKLLGRIVQTAAGVSMSSFVNLTAWAEAKGIRVPWSEGTERPSVQCPPHAADCHHHIYDARFSPAPGFSKPANATVADYRLLQKRIGTVRHVVVQPSAYGIDNSCLIDALRQFGPSARGIAVVDTSVSDEELQRLHAANVRGIRFNMLPAGATTQDMIEPLARRIARFGWHVQVNMSSDQIMGMQDIWERLACPVVFDHLGHILEPEGTGDPALPFIVSLLKQKKAWVKLSGAYVDSKVKAPTYADSAAVVKAYLREAPDRLVWGSDWPHPSERIKPDDALMLELLAQWAGSRDLLHAILVSNPEALYGFYS